MDREEQPYTKELTEFYDRLAPLYHLVFENWDDGIEEDGERVAAIIREQWPEHRSILDVTCGIGTQAIGLARRGFAVTGSDLSRIAVARATTEAQQRKLAIAFSVSDVREAYQHHGGGFDLVISCDNAICHLLSDQDILAALNEMKSCLRPGGGCLLTVRDYAREARGTNIVKPYGLRVENGKRYIGFQVWDFAGEIYHLTIFFIEEDQVTKAIKLHAMRSRYYAISTDRLLGIMRQAGFLHVKRLDDVFYQPVLVGTKAP